MSSFRVAALTLTVTAGIIAAGCSAGAPLSPTGPSTSTNTGISGAAIETTETSSLASDASVFDTQRDKGQRAPGALEHGRHGNNRGNDGVQANGRISALDAAARTITVDATNVNVPATATIRHGSETLKFTDLKVGDHVEVKGAMTNAVLVATEVKVEPAGAEDEHPQGGDRTGAPHEVELRGAVSAKAGTCPALTFTVQATKVTTSASTLYRGITCAAVANATVVEVKGTKQADGSVTATRVAHED